MGKTAKHIKGGLRRKDRDISSLQSLLNMITNKHAKLTVISANSLKGFLFKLDILGDPDKETNCQYQGINATQGRVSFSRNIYSVILKFAITSQNETGLNDLIIRNPTNNIRIQKSTDAIIDYKNECAVQGQIYRRSIIPVGTPICPGVVNLSFFNPTASTLLLNLLRTKIGPPEGPSRDMIDYMIDILRTNPTYKLGLIAMELAEDSVHNKFEQLKYIIRGGGDAAKNGLVRTIAQLLRLFSQCKIINTDLHTGNSLVKTDGREALLIDFGRFVDFTVNYRRDDIKTRYEQISGTRFEDDVRPFNIGDTSGTNLFTARRGYAADIDEIKQKICRVLKIIAVLDYSTLFEEFGMTDVGPQMNALLKFLNYGYSDDWLANPPNWRIPADKDIIFQEIYDNYILYITNPSTQSQVVTIRVIDEGIRTGVIFEYNNATDYDNSRLLLDILRRPVASPMGAPMGAPIVPIRMDRDDVPQTCAKFDWVKCLADSTSECCKIIQNAFKGGKTRKRKYKKLSYRKIKKRSMLKK
jgi:hypothetical protein